MQYLLLFLTLLLTGCGCRFPYPTEGAQEFVLDSYKIRQGKMAILAMEGECLPSLPPEYLCEYEDTIDEDDILLISVYHPKRKDISQAIEEIGTCIGYRVINGQVCLPELPPIPLVGLTLEQARQRIRQLYASEINNIDIFIEYEERLHSKVELTGDVRVPQVPVNGRIRLYEVLSIAGVPNTANLFKSYVVRDCSFLPIDLYKLVHEGDMSQNIVMRPKDKIFIASPLDSTVMVMGEVGYASVIPLPKGFISLREAIAAAGGIPYTGDKQCIQVIRGNILHPKIYRLSWNHIVHLPNDSLLLMPGDTVFISEAPITKWNRFIEQLLPSGLLIDLGIKTRGLFN